MSRPKKLSDGTEKKLRNLRPFKPGQSGELGKDVLEGLGLLPKGKCETTEVSISGRVGD